MPDASKDATSEGRDYKDTLFLPETQFPMRAGLPKAEPQWLKRWADMDMYKRLREAAKGRTKYILHDGPPYANGHLHMGHAFNKVLKDLVVRSRQMLGYDANYVPGWDCHVLPIEWQVEKEFAGKGRAKREVSKNEFRSACRVYAEKWVDIQREEFKRYGIEGDWDNPYTTMAFGAEAAIVNELLKFVDKDLLYRGSKPVMWSPVEQTALAEAEIEYHDHQSTTIWVKFPVRDVMADGTKTSDLHKSASVVIWTTTPWTIPGNRAICYGPKLSYSIYEVEEMKSDLGFEPWSKPGDRLIVADALAESVREAGLIGKWKRIATAFPGGLVCDHPLKGLGGGYEFDVPLLAGDHVTDEAGTGFVHTAPGHGQEDYIAWVSAFGMEAEIPHTVDEYGAYTEEAPGFEGARVLVIEGKKKGKEGDANKRVIEALIEKGKLLARGRLVHSYPHSWRSKAPVIFRNTPQWFIRLSGQGEGGLRDTALNAIDETQFTPASGKNRIRAMVEGRPDWLVSRQRAWGVPIAIFVNTKGEPLNDPKVNARIVEAVKARGADAWFDTPAQDFLGDDYSANEYEKVEDILDAVLTHGFVLDDQGRKMSKSLGNVTDPAEITKAYGADILRIWTASSDYSDDLRIGKEIIGSAVDSYRKLRNTLRYLLGALAGFSDAERVDPKDMPELERYILHRLAVLDGEVRAGYEKFDFKGVWRKCLDFASLELSAFYLDIRKDSLYCDRPEDLGRRAARTVMAEVFDRLVIWLAPVCVFTMEEAWLSRYPSDDGSVHLELFPETPKSWRDDALGAKWKKIREVRRVVTGALEVERREKRIGASLEAAPVVHIADADLLKAYDGLDAAELFITSGATLTDKPAPENAFRLEGETQAVAVAPVEAEGEKCRRCWRILPEVGVHESHGDLCERCIDAVEAVDAKVGA